MTNSNDEHTNENEKNNMMVTPWQEANKEYVENITDEQRTTEDEGERPEPEIKIPDKSTFSLATLKQKQTPQEKELYNRLTIILSCLAIATLVTLYFISPFSKVDKIILSGLKSSEPKQIVTSSQIEVGKSIWPQYVNKTSSIKEIKKANPRIQSAKISLVNINQMKISVTEFPTIGYVKKDNKTFELLSNGVILKEKTDKPSDKLPLLLNFKEGENLDEFLKAYAKFDEKLKENIVNIESVATKKNPFRIKFTMKDGNEVIALSTTVADKMVFYSKIVDEMKGKGIIDMEAGTSGVFSYPFETTETTESIDSQGFGESQEQNLY